MARLSVRKILVFTLLLILALCFQSNMFSFAVEETEPTTETTTVKEAWAIETENMTVNLKEKDPLYVDAKTTEDGSVLSFESSDESIATVNSKTGQLTLKKTGTATIHVTAAENEMHSEATADATVTVYKLDAPKIYKINNAIKGVRITWSEVSDAKGYIVYRRKCLTEAEKVKAAEAATATEESSSTETTEETEPSSESSTESTAKASSSKASSSTKSSTTAKTEASSVTTEETSTEATEETTADLEEKVSADEATKVENEWKQLKKFTSHDSITMIDSTAENGVYYEYCVVAYNKNDLQSIKADPKKIVFLAAPTSIKISKVSSTKKKVTWAKNSSASGYTIQYAKHRTMIACKEKKIKKGSATSTTLSNLAKNRTYYARVRAYKKVDGITYISAYGSNPNGLKDKTVSISVLKYKTVNKKGETVKKTLDIPKAAKQGVYDNSIMQGGCTDGTYGYYALIDKQGTDKLTDDTQKIAKVKLSTGKLVKLSGNVPIDHANDMTYDSNKKRIVVVHNMGGSDKVKKRITTINPSTLKVIGKKDIVIPTKLEGSSASKLKEIKGLCSVAYNKKKQQFIFLISGSHNLLFTDKDFNPIKFVKIDDSQKTNNSYWYCQGMDATNNFIYVLTSPKSGSNYNKMLMYDWAGNLKCTIHIKKGYEIENVFHVSDKWYAGFYTFHKVGNKYIRSGYVYKFTNF